VNDVCLQLIRAPCHVSDLQSCPATGYVINDSRHWYVSDSIASISCGLVVQQPVRLAVFD